ncbi:MAG: fumarylacetoacetate hydrolase family protein [Bacteroidia bacterium]|jgi:2-keto-4-pentenoate hydratase/2-oxohepta-3-ene-1,7-dioic acid hydratase in catechol pathway
MKILCVGRNYAEHARELGNAVPEDPVIFSKPDTALLKNGDDFYLPEFSQDIHHEIELVIRINKMGKKIQEKFAHTYYNEIGVGIDFTARDMQSKLKSKGLPWELAKAFDSSAVLGDFIQPDMERKEPIAFRLDKNGTTVQQGITTDMIFSFDQIVAFVSNYFTLKVGDLIYTGTPSGVGRVVAGDLLTGFIGDKQMLSCRVR